MDALTQERILSLTRHLTTLSGGGTVGVSATPGDPVIYGLPLSGWLGVLTVIAGCVNAWFSKPERPAP